MDFDDRLLNCSDCGSDFIFTAGEQLFFFDRQFKNDPKRCKLCKAKRAGLGRATSEQPGQIAHTGVTAILPLSRTETRTECSACGIETTVPFRPTQGRPVFCRSCFQLKRLPNSPGVSLDAPPVGFSAATMAAIADTPAAALQSTEYSTGLELHASTEAMDLA